LGGGVRTFWSLNGKVGRGSKKVGGGIRKVGRKSKKGWEEE
jgi:hypothetical protein